MADGITYDVYPGLLTAAEKLALTQYYPGEEAARALVLWAALPDYEQWRRVGQTTQPGWRPHHGVTGPSGLRILYPPQGPIVFIDRGVSGPGSSSLPDLGDSLRSVIPQPSGPFARAHPPDWTLAGLFPQAHGSWDDPPVGS